MNSYDHETRSGNLTIPSSSQRVDASSRSNGYPEVFPFNLSGVIGNNAMQLLLRNNPASSGTAALPPNRLYDVADGDSLWKIAARFYGDGLKWSVIQRANVNKYPSLNINPDFILPGWKLYIPSIDPADMDATEIIKKAIMAVRALNARYTDVGTYSNTNLLLKGQGPKRDTDEYNVLYNYHGIYRLPQNLQEIINIINKTEQISDGEYTEDDLKSLALWRVETGGQTLENDYGSINSDSKPADPIYIQVNGNTVKITANLWIYGSGADLPSNDTKANSEENQVKFRNLIADGIKEKISGDYWINCRWVTVAVTVIDNTNQSAMEENEGVPGGQLYLNINMNSGAGRARGGVRVASTWGRSSPGAINMFSSYQKDSGPASINNDNYIKGVAAHEFFHTSGLDDAYKVQEPGNWQREEAPESQVNRNDIMRTAYGNVSTLTIIMLLTAFKSNMVQRHPGR